MCQPLSQLLWPGGLALSLARQRSNAYSRGQLCGLKVKGGNGFWAGQSTDATCNGNRSQSLPHGCRAHERVHHDLTTHGTASASSPCCFLSQNCLPSSLPQLLYCLLILQGLTPLHLPLLKLSPATRVFIRHLLPLTSDPLALTVLRSVSFQLFVGLTGFLQRQLAACPPWGFPSLWGATVPCPGVHNPKV